MSIRSGVATQLYDLVVDDSIDAALTLKPSSDLPKTLGWKLLREEPLILLVPQRLGRISALQLLREQPLIRYDRSLGGGKLADHYMRDAGIAPRERFELTSLLAISMMVERGLGVALVPDTPCWTVRACCGYRCHRQGPDGRWDCCGLAYPHASG